MRNLLSIANNEVRATLRGDRMWLSGVVPGAALAAALTLVKIAFPELIGRPAPFLLYFIAIVAATYRGGVCAGLLTTVLAVVISAMLFLDVGVTPWSAIPILCLFMVEGFAISTIMGGFLVQRQEAQKAAREAEAARGKLDVVLSGIGEGITLQDGQGKLIYANQHAADLVGCSSPQELLNIPPAELMDRFEMLDEKGEPLSHERLPGRQLLMGKKTADELKIRFRKRGAKKDQWSVVRSNAVFDEGNRARFIVNLFRDVTEVHRREEELSLAREWFQIALRSIGDAVIATDSDGRINLLNPVAERLTGWSTEGALGKPIADVFRIFNEHTREPVNSPVLQVLQDGTPRGLANHTLLLRPDGSEIAIDDSAAPIKRADGSIAGVILVFRDVSSRRAEEQRAAFLARATGELSSSLDYRTTLKTVARLAVPVIADWCAVDILEGGEVERLAVAHVDPNKIAQVEELARRYPPDPDAPRGLHNILRTGAAELIPEIPDELLEGVAKDEEHLRFIRALGLRSYIGVPLMREGKAFGVITLVMAESNRLYESNDLAVAKSLADRASLAVDNALLYKRAEEARRLAESANNTKDEFLAMLGHELRNPLAPIRTALELMRTAPDASASFGGDAMKLHPRQRELAVIERQVNHLVRLVDDLLDVARITKGRLELDRKVVSAAEVIERAREMVWPTPADVSHTVHIDVNPQLTLYCDPLRIAQVIANLLLNAVKYTAEGGNIWISAGDHDDTPRIGVRDDGIGIGPDTLREVFESFVQEPQALDRARGGLGLGLSIVRGLVAAHGGKVSAHSEGTGRGAEFVVDLPRGNVTSTDPPKQADARAKASKSRRILVVDDNEDAREMLGELLRLLGHEVSTACDGPAALAVAQKASFDVALLDIGLPGMDGYQLGKALRGIEGMQDIQLVATTGYGQASDRAKSQQANFQGHLVKPFELHTLEALLEKLAG